jgi:hypothetical protein
MENPFFIVWGKKDMKANQFVNNKEADVLGLPMYLIIIMIVAVAVIAAVVYMIPKGTKTMNAQVTANALMSETPAAAVGAGRFVFTSTFAVTVSVTTNDERADPINGATVTLAGAGVAVQGTTGVAGTVTLAAVSPILDANINEAHMTLTVKAAGYEDFSDDTAVTVMRLG